MQTHSAQPAQLPPHLQPRRRLATVKQASAAFDGLFSEQALRDLIFKAEDRFNFRGDRIRGNGLAEHGAIVRLGRRVLLDLDGFESWLDSHKAR